MAESPNRYVAFVDPRYTPSERRQIGIEIVNYIVERSKQGLGIGRKPFKRKYSENYVKTNEFKIAGKSPRDVNLTLSGDMLDSVVVEDTSTIGRIVIGMSSDVENDKSVWLEDKGFNFLGLTDRELRSILESFGPPEAEDAPADISDSLVEGFVRGILGR
jgi:hypothetical protein